MFKIDPEKLELGGLEEWVELNQNAILEGTAEYRGVAVHQDTVFYNYAFVVSLILVTLPMSTGYLLPSKRNLYLWWAPPFFTIVTLCLGWWSFPLGPFVTLYVLANGKKKRTALNLIQKKETGFDQFSTATVDDCMKEVIAVSESAKTAIEAKRKSGRFHKSMAVRVMPRRLPIVNVSFDEVVLDGRDWIDYVDETPILIDKKHEAKLSGLTLDFRDGEFICEFIAL